MNGIRTRMDQVIQDALISASHGEIYRAIDMLDDALDLCPDHRMARIERGRLYFKIGKIQQAIKDFEYFYNNFLPSFINLFAREKINCGQLEGRTIIITSDAGIGDMLQFVRYGVVLKRYGARVIVECSRIFFDLFNSQSWIDKCIEPGRIDFDFTYRIPLHYLIGAFGADIHSIPSFPYYIKPEKNLILSHADIRNGEKINLGISWRSANEDNNFWTSGRGINLIDLLALIDRDAFKIIPIQKEISFQEKEVLAHYGIEIYSSRMTDINQTAAIIHNCDLVISTCTMTPHLSGSMGIPTFTLLSKNSCWRWMTDQSETFWYPSMKLFRQNKLNDWTNVLQELSEHLYCIKLINTQKL